MIEEEKKAYKRMWAEKNKERVRKSKREYYLRNKDKVKKRASLWKNNNPDRRKVINKNYYENNKEKCKDSSDKWTKANPEKVHKNAARWRKDNPEKVRVAHRKYIRKRSRLDPEFRASRNIRSRISVMVRSCGMSTSQLTGCSPSYLRSHLESLFQEGMTWENYGSYWHVDHVLPLASFDLTDLEQIKYANHWLNLQPLKAAENLAKGANITEPQQHLLLTV